MGARDRFLTELYRRTEGRTDRTVHTPLHIAKPLGMSEVETRAIVAALLRDGFIATDPMFDRLIFLTPAGVVACERPNTADTVVGVSVTDETYVPLAALRGMYADIGLAAGERELIAQ